MDRAPLQPPAPSRWLAAARALLWLEAAWPSLVGLAALAATFAALVLLDALPRLPGWAHLASLAVFVFLAVRLKLDLLRTWPGPTPAQAARRLENDSGLAHRPLTALDDRPPTDDPAGLALWTEHRRRAAASLSALRLSWPRSDMAARDPYGWRAAALLLLVIALAGGTDQAAGRLVHALAPDLGLSGLGPERVDVWLTPPPYTGLAPTALQPGQKVAMPAGTKLSATAIGGWGGLSLKLAGQSWDFERADGEQKVSADLNASGEMVLSQWGRTLASWPVTAIVDAVPSVAFTNPPQPGERGRLLVSVTASDDYGLARLWMEIRRAGLDQGQEAPLIVLLPLAANAPKAVQMDSWHDLSAHPWAGQPVTIRPLVADGAGQSSGAEWLSITLPERQFRHPGARAVIEQRRQLALSTVRILDVVVALDAISNETAMFGDDLVAFLALRVARHALMDENFDPAEVQDLLWNAALRIEDGDLATAERSLEEARRALEQAVAEGGDGARIERLLAEFQAAMSRWLQALAARAPDGASPIDRAARVIDAEDLAAMLDTARDLARNGAREALAELLREMGALLQSIEQGSGQTRTIEGLGQLHDVIRRQQALLDHSHRQSRTSPAPSGAASARGQGQVGQALDQATASLADALGQAPAGLDQAGLLMEEAVRALKADDWAQAALLQNQALDLLRKTASEITASGQAASSLRDPLGRPAPGHADDGATRVPPKAELGKSQRILEELRRRAADPSRPAAERDYLHRLLKQF